MNIYSIYKVTNIINNKIYIGFTKQTLERRKQNHYHDVRRKRMFVFQQALKKYDPEYFTWEIIYQSIDGNYTLNIMEEYFIRLYNTHIDDGWGYNMTYGGLIPTYGLANKSRAQKKKQIPWCKGLILSPRTQEVKDKISYTRLLNKIGRGKDNSNYDSTIHIFKHRNGKLLTGSRFELVNTFPEENLSSYQLGLILRCKIKTHKGWTIETPLST